MPGLNAATSVAALIQLEAPLRGRTVRRRESGAKLLRLDVVELAKMEAFMYGPHTFGSLYCDGS